MATDPRALLEAFNIALAGAALEIAGSPALYRVTPTTDVPVIRRMKDSPGILETAPHEIRSESFTNTDCGPVPEITHWVI